MEESKTLFSANVIGSDLKAFFESSEFLKAYNNPKLRAFSAKFRRALAESDKEEENYEHNH
jgi:hypothetical protein